MTTELNDVERELIAYARQVAAVKDDVDGVKDFTGFGNPEEAWSSAFGIAQGTIGDLLNLIERLAGTEDSP